MHTESIKTAGMAEVQDFHTKFLKKSIHQRDYTFPLMVIFAFSIY